MTARANIGSFDGTATIGVSSQTILVLLLMHALFSIAFVFWLPANIDAWAVGIPISTLVSQITAISFAIVRGARVSPFLTTVPNGRSETLRATLACFLAASGVALLQALIRPENGAGLEVTAPSIRLFELVAGVLLIPFLEEVLFRGVLLQSLSKSISPTLSVVVAALVFAAFHVSLVSASSALVLGLLVGIAFIRTRSILVCSVGHLTWNLTMSVVDRLGVAHRVIEEISASDFAVIFATAAVALGAVTIGCSRKDRPRGAEKIVSP